VAKALRNHAAVIKNPPQTVQASPLQVQNNAGGYSFEVTDKTRLERFLILGTDGGTYYVSEKDLTKQNVDFLRNLIKKDESLVLNTAVEISKAGRAYRNDAAIFVMAMLLAEGKNKAATIAAIPSVVRTGTHVYTLAEFISSLGGWGRSKRDAIANWFTSQSPDQLAYQAVKYRQRNGWTMRDLMRKSHPKGLDKNVGNFILGQPYSDPTDSEILHGFSLMQQTPSVERAVELMNSYRNLSWETIPTQYLTDLRIWKKLFENGQLKGQALLRNVTRLAKMNAFDDMGFAREIANAMLDEEMIRKTRLHPMQYLNAYVVYTKGQIIRELGYAGNRSKNWNTSGIIQDALDDGFGLSFGNIEPSNKRMMISVDVSSSMSWHQAGTSNFTAAQGAGAMALITARVEPTYVVNGFTSGLTNLNLTARDSIESAFRKVQRGNFGGTDCSLPVTYALSSGIEVDTFVVITDNETYAGSTHPHNALKNYRNKMGIDARMVVMGMAANNFSIANPLDKGMLDVVGFDTNTPKVVSDFSAGRI
jgi:60 kDa SS-A/Ro ribonucleoprotein